MSKIKVISLLALSLALVGIAYAYDYNTNLPLPGKSIANTKLQADAMFPIYAVGLRIATPDCKSFSIIDTQVSQKATENVNQDKSIKSSWEEIWTVKACSRTADIPIRFTTENNNSTYSINSLNIRVHSK